MFICLVTTNEFVRCWLFYSVLHKSSAACVALCGTANSHQRVCTLLACVFYFSCTSSHAREKKNRQKKKKEGERQKRARACAPASQPACESASERATECVCAGGRERKKAKVCQCEHKWVGGAEAAQQCTHTRTHIHTLTCITCVCAREMREGEK
mmetsp:Transcript_21900/g.35130  ORF Transcript_21900/g.35130 Transcript_21900/m.35130 type:complete len:155 (-) Transcript_21900:73-537(-)